MKRKLEDTLRLIQNRIEASGGRSVFIPMSDFPWYHERNGQLTKLYENGYVTKPRFQDNGVVIALTADGREYLERISRRIQFKNINESMPCPVCGYQAKILQTSAARDWAELHCENCLSYAIKADALENSDNLYLFSGYVRHHQPHMTTVHCHDEESVQEITTTSMPRNEQIRYLLSFYYQKMTRFGEYISFEPFPAIAYAKNEEDLRNLVQYCGDCGYVLFENEMISVTEVGKDFMDEQAKRDMEISTPPRPTVFISYNHGSKEIADKIDSRLKPYADAKIDRRCIKPWGSIKEFMNSICDQDFVVLVISDSYLKSIACLYEVMQMMRERNWDERVMYVVTDDAHGVYDSGKQINYIGYWEKTEEKLREAIKGHNPAAVSHQAEELKKISLITLHIGEFLIKLADAMNPSVDDAIEKIGQRVRGSTPNPPEHSDIIATDEFEDKIIRVGDNVDNHKSNNLITQAMIEAGGEISSINDLTERLSVSITTVKRGLQQAIQDGEIETNGTGCHRTYRVKKNPNTLDG